MVYVQDINGKPMMPTTRHGKVRRLLKDKKAVVVNLCPFTIKLMYVTSDYKQEIVLGVDAGTKHVGLSATTKSKELYSSEVILRNDIVDLLSTRRELRRSKGGIKRPNQSPFEVFGFRLFDRVMFENSYYFIFARRKTGSFNIRDIDGKNQRDITYKKLKLSRCKRFMVQKEMD